MQISFAEIALPKSGALVVLAAEDAPFAGAAATVDRATSGALTRAKAASRFTGGKGQFLELMAPAGVNASRVLVAGLGKPARLDALAVEAIGGKVVTRLAKSGETHVAIAVDKLNGVRPVPDLLAAHVGYGARLASYRFDLYRTKLKPEQKPSLSHVAVLVGGAGAARRAYAPLEKIADGVDFTRDLVTEPGNVIFPESFAKRASDELEALGCEVEVLDEKAMKKLGMGALLGVGQGSERESRLLVARWSRGPKNQAPVAFVGKGVTFDTGGISIKPAGGMEDMKWDMGGAGTVVGLMKALAGRKARVNAIGVAGLVENMPDANAQRPGDVVTSMSGQTIEVLNTDAEGRLVLADAIHYTIDKFKPQFVVDLATLTGAMIVALGHEYAGLFSNNDQLATRLFKAGQAEGELVWRMPLADAYDRSLESQIADMQNIGGDRAAGSITAAHFIKRFVGDTPWAHLDIAGVAWSKKDKPTLPKGATAFGVRMLDRLVRDHYEGK
jgi:leucyl aminopeptidase